MNFCDTPLWDVNVSWNAVTNPDLTPCFRSAILVWIPCFVFLLLCPLELRKIIRSKDKPTRWGCLNITKLVLNISLCLMLLIEEIGVNLQYASFSITPISEVTGPVVNLITIVGITAYSQYARLRGATVSLLLSTFWLTEVICAALVLRSEAMEFSSTSKHLPLIIKATIASLVVLQFLLSCVAEPSGHETDWYGSLFQDVCPMKNIPFFSRIFFTWMTRTFLQGVRGELDQYSMLPMCDEMKCLTVSKVFEKESRSRRTISSNVLQSPVDETTPLLPPPPTETTPSEKRPSYVWILYKIIWFYLTLSAILELLSVAFGFVAPFMINSLLDFIKGNEPYWHGFIYVALFYLGSMLTQMTSAHSQHIINIAAIQVKSSLIDALYKKLFYLSSTTKREHTSGEIINLMAVDAEELFEYVEFISQIWVVPIRVLACLYFLWVYLGPSCLVGLAIIAALSPITAFVGTKVDYNYDKRMGFKDDRMKIMNEILNGIKVLKLYAWERPFIRRVKETRDNELSSMNTLLYWDSCFVFLWSSAPMVVALATFAVYLCVDENHVLDANTAFVSLAVFNLLRFPMGLIPDLLNRTIRTRVSLRRLTSFLNSKELDSDNVGNNCREGEVITIDSGEFTWALDQQPALRNIRLHIKKGSLVAVVGPVGSGKSSLLSALLGEMYKTKGSVEMEGSVAYVPQIAWIQNATLEKNVLFTWELASPFASPSYQQVVNCCALKPDLEMLPGGDQTEIGEKGINLSGGQKQRVSLARAVFQDKDIYLLDDPLSAVDSHVAAHLFKEVIGASGLLRKKTRILVTHNVAVLPEVDHIIVLDRGCIVVQGSFKELKAREGKFADYLQQHLQQKDEKKVHSKNYYKRVLSRELSRISKHSDVSGYDDESEDEEDYEGRLIEEEAEGRGKIHIKVYLDYFRTIGLSLFLFGVLTSVLCATCETGSGIWLSVWSKDEPLPSGMQDIPLRNERLIVYALFVFGHGVLIVLTALLIWSGGIRASRTVHNSLLYHIMKAPMYFFDSTPVGRILNRFSKDMEDIDVEIPQNLNFWLTSAVWFPGVLVIVALNSIYLLLALLPLGILYYYVQKLYIKTTRQLRRMTATRRSPIYSNFSETLAGVSCIRAFNVEDHFVEKCQDQVDTYLNCYYLEKSANRWMEISLYIIGGMVALGAALTAVLGRGSLDVGLVGLALTYSLEITDGLGWLVRISAHLESSIVALERVRDYMGAPQEADWESTIKPLPEWPEEGNITIRNLSAAHREGQEPVLRSINLNIPSGQKVAVVGRTGAGKSSLVLSLFRIIEPLEGTIYIDGLDTAEVGLHDLRSKLAVIPQDPVVFAGSLRMNLDPWDEHSDEEVWTALEHSHLKEFVSNLPESIQFTLAEGGENLSAGQRQLVCLTRALLRRTRIIVLDEATASVDLDTDQLIQTTIRESFSHCTIITIAHRLHTIMDYDRVIVLSNGEVIEDGNPDKLRRNPSSHFYSLAKDAGLT